MGTSRSPLSLLLLQLASSTVCLLFFVEIATAQATEPAEVKALKTMLLRLGINSLYRETTSGPSYWNTTPDPCGRATPFDINDFQSYDETSTIMTCDCSTNTSDGTCHITGLKLDGMGLSETIPQELHFFKNLKGLSLSENYLTGSLPTFFGNFTDMQYLDLHDNALSGPIPKELGNLKNLRVLDLHANALSGPIPKELGNLKNLRILDIGTNDLSGTIPPELGIMIGLKELHMDSSGLNGDIPSELSNLKTLTALWISDNDFTGKVPEFFGSLTHLRELRMQGNSFQGPIPASFSNLVNMRDLRIGDIIDGSSTLSFIGSMKFLEKLTLRNCKISDVLPSDFSRYNNTLRYLDLSFNNITGSIPQSLFNLNRLNFVFLGNNGLSGKLPEQKSSPLTSLDLSYNQLTGAFPSWVSESVFINLVANNFVAHDINRSALPQVLQCLQNDMPCNRDSPIYSSFAINCGGNVNITSSDGVTYEPDSDNNYYYDYNHYYDYHYYYYYYYSIKWAISSVGTAVDSDISNGDTFTRQPIIKTSDTELLQTSRLSTSSLRYYGLGLENGHYAVKLQFAETQLSNNVGRRIFDIYIQGDLKEKDFDITKEAGGTSFTAVVKEYTVTVANNFLEIHFFWAGKGTWRVPIGGSYGPLIAAISVSRKGSCSLVFVVGLTVGAIIVVLAVLCLILRHLKRKKKMKEEIERELHTLFMNVNPNIFSYREMRAATKDFSSPNKLGEGGYGPVFRGKLPDGKIVAVKQLSKTSHQGMHQFLSEIATISVVQHRNLVKLLGYCIKGEERILVYEFVENKSLEQAIFGKSKLYLDWPKRFEICMGVAKGLAYLHEESPVRIVHRDVKASNILLDADLNPKISDFGLAKLYDEKKTHVSTRVAGTIGYLAPEYAIKGHLTKKVDVYAFGLLCLEILAGRPNLNQSLETEKIYLLDWAWCLHENKRDLELVDGSLSSFNEDEVRRVIGVALLCTQSLPAQRPLMSRVVAMLAGDVEVIQVTTRPGYLDYTTTSSQAIAGGQGVAIMSTPSDADSLMNSFLEQGR